MVGVWLWWHGVCLQSRPCAPSNCVEVVDEYEFNDILIMHGHKEIKIPKNIKTIVIAHEHPAVSLKDGPRQETYKCFLKGKYKRKELIVLPSLNLVTEGTDMLKQDFLSPFLHQNLDNFGSELL